VTWLADCKNMLDKSRCDSLNELVIYMKIEKTLLIDENKKPLDSVVPGAFVIDVIMNDRYCSQLPLNESLNV
jgi:hypothetical protein